MTTILANETRDSFLVADWTSVETLPPGMYQYDMGHMGMSLALKPVSAERFEHTIGSQQSAMDTIASFWTNKHLYDAIGVPHRTGILMSGAPGTGKTAVLRHAVRAAIDAGGYAIQIGDPEELEACVKIIRQCAAGKPMLLVCEDIDANVGNNDAYWTQLLDGVAATLDGCLTIATTNHMERLSKRLIRPGRFDLHLEITSPTADERRDYIASLWKVPANHPDIAPVVALTDGKVMAEVRAQAVARFVRGLTPMTMAATAAAKG